MAAQHVAARPTSDPQPRIEIAPGYSIPHELDDKHRDELHASGIYDETIQRVGVFSASDADIAKLLRWQPKDFQWGRGLVYPYRFPNEPRVMYHRVKLDYPRESHGKTAKYESGLNAPRRAYFGPGFFKRFKQAGVVLVTEGEKKTLALAQLGYPAIGLVGVWGWQKKRQRDRDDRPFGKRELIPDLAEIDWRGITIVIVFDSDAVRNTNIQVAEAHLAQALTARGAAVKVARIPADGEDAGKVGIDDFLVAQGANARDELASLLESATPPRHDRRQATATNLLTLVADLLRKDGRQRLRMARYYRPPHHRRRKSKANPP